MAIMRLTLLLTLLLVTCTPGDKTSTADPDTGTDSASDTSASNTTITPTTGDPPDPSDDEVGECSNRLPPIDQTEVPPGKVGEPYTVTFTVGDDTTLDWTLTSDDPPPGLGFDAATATLSGTPTLAGEYKIAIQASVSFDDSECPTHPATADYTLTIAP
jgi:hypothetical protein